MSEHGARSRPPMHVVSFEEEVPLCVHPDVLYALGGSVKMDGTTSWMPPDSTGWLPYQCYALCDADNVVIIDTGLPIHAGAIRSGLVALAASRPTRTLLMTRREMDTLLNLPWIVSELEVDAVQYVGDLNPFDFFASFETATAAAHFKATSSARLEMVRPDTTQTIGSFDITTMRGSIRTLATNWLHDRKTKTLFTSDCWAFLTADSPAGPMIASAAEVDRITVHDLIAHFNAKFDWLQGADVDVVEADIRRIFHEMEIECLCPTHGKIIAGRGAIAGLLEKTFEALKYLGGIRRASLMDGFPLDAA